MQLWLKGVRTVFMTPEAPTRVINVMADLCLPRMAWKHNPVIDWAEFTTWCIAILSETEQFYITDSEATGQDTLCQTPVQYHPYSIFLRNRSALLSSSLRVYKLSKDGVKLTNTCTPDSLKLLTFSTVPSPMCRELWDTQDFHMPTIINHHFSQ